MGRMFCLLNLKVAPAVPVRKTKLKTARNKHAAILKYGAALFIPLPLFLMSFFIQASGPLYGCKSKKRPVMKCDWLQQLVPPVQSQTPEARELILFDISRHEQIMQQIRILKSKNMPSMETTCLSRIMLSPHKKPQKRLNGSKSYRVSVREGGAPSSGTAAA
ncbi:MAG: hypothetical protein R6W75_07095 [Smithellaceae bacterium]